LGVSPEHSFSKTIAESAKHAKDAKRRLICILHFLALLASLAFFALIRINPMRKLGRDAQATIRAI
jgi:hypothetical protein